MAKQQAAAAGAPDFQAQALAEFAAELDADPSGVLPLWDGKSHPCGDSSNNFKPWPGITCNAPTAFVTGISLRGKALSGLLPDSISVLKTLRSLDLSNNAFYGSLPLVWSNFTSLDFVDLSHNKLTGPLPAAFSAWEAMQTLELHHNMLTGQLPGAWAGMNLLEVLDLSSNRLVGSLPDSWARMSFLSVLSLQNNSLTGTLPVEWAEQRALLNLNLGGNLFEGLLPAEWAAGMDSLRVVNITDNSLSAEHLLAFKAAVADPSAALATWRQGSNPCGAEPWHGVSCKDGRAVAVLLGGQSLRGPLTKGLVKVANLHELHLDNNQLTGTLPASWGEDAVPSLAVIDLSQNGLTGPLPDTWSRLVSLQRVNLSFNDLDGQLPEAWSAITNLTTLVLNSNRRLNGTLPASWAALGTLQQANLDSTAIQGSLPASWAKLSQMRELRLSNNMLTGAVPTAWRAGMQNLSLDLTGNQQMCGKMPTNWDLQASRTEIGKKCKSQGIPLTASIAVGVCASVVGTALLASAAYLIVRSRQSPSAQLAVLASRSMATSTVGFSRPPSRPASPGSSISGMAAMSLPPPSPPSTARSPTPLRVASPTPSLVSPAPPSPAVVALAQQQQHRLADEGYGSGSWESSQVHTPLRTPAQSVPGSPAVGAWGSAIKARESSQGTPLRPGSPSSLAGLRARMERLFGHERPASPTSELAMSSLAAASDYSRQRFGVEAGGFGVDAAAAAPEDEEAAVAADAAAGGAAAGSADAAPETMAGGAAGAAFSAADLEADGALEENDDLVESAATGSAAMAQAPLVAVALGGTQGLAWPGSPVGGGFCPASMLLMGSGLPSPRGVAALMARTPQSAGLASAAAADAEADAAAEDEAASDGEQ
ncbi:hypothetical protein OEZ85_011159 [Tetradesmus obliquus]|uniref:Leucine-rich repeat-containing N-terminal plant-type domain-containing protein n=1 Tax=Tetradesmus obliquus TaxID=3088 RepID=A0ABY8TPF7_TETOB|nr:hypothetical protein OEZ85_011159 [Tetradesmus obliquus]